MSDLAIVKEEPTIDLNAAPLSGTKSPQGELSTDLTANPTQLSLIHSTIPSLPHLSNTPNTTNTNTNPFGPSSYTHKSMQPPFPPPFSTSMPPIPPLPNSFPPHTGYHTSFPPSTHTPFPPVPFPTNPNDPSRSQPYPIPNPMFYAPVFGQQPPMPPYHSTPSTPHNHEYNGDTGTTQHTAPNSSSATPPNDTHSSSKATANPSSSSNTNKPYTFTPGMQPGAYYLIPLNTPNGQSSHHNTNGQPQHQPMTPYMPLINQTESQTDTHDESVTRDRTGSTNTNASDTSSPTSHHESDNDSDAEDTNDQNTSHDTNDTQDIAVQPHHTHPYQTQPPFLYHGSSMNAPFLNVLSPINQSQNGAPPHLPFSIPLTPTNTHATSNGREQHTHQFPPPPLPLPYPDLNHLNSTQFSLAPILSVGGGADTDKGQLSNEDKKNIIMPEDHKRNHTVSSFIMQQLSPMQQSQPLSFPPLPTNNHMNHNRNNMNRLNSNFAGAELSESMDDLNGSQGPPMLTPERERGDSSDQDMDVAVALGTIHHNDTMPMIQNNHNNNNNHNSAYYHNITPFNKTQQKSKTKIKRISSKKITKRIRKHSHRKKVKAVAHTHDLSASNYQDISVHVPALNRMKVPASKLQHNGRRAMRTPRKRCNRSNRSCTPNMEDIPDLSDHEHKTNASSTHHESQYVSPPTNTLTSATAVPAPAVPMIPAVIGDSMEVEGQMEVAYSQQYPQVGFPYIYNSEGENGKKFTCKFMDAISIIDGQPGFCDRQFGQKCHWMRHCLEKHVPTEMSQRYQCRECNMKYAQNSSLKEHVAICHSNKPPSFKCPYCTGDITFTRWTSVLRHCRNQHPDQEEPKKQMRGRTRPHHQNNNNNNAEATKTKHKRKTRKKSGRNNHNNHNNHNHNSSNHNHQNCNHQNQNKNRNHYANENDNNNNCNSLMDLEDTISGMPPLNIMPSVNMNISMNQMLSSNNNHHPAYVAGVAILPPDLHRTGNGIG